MNSYFNGDAERGWVEVCTVLPGRHLASAGAGLGGERVQLEVSNSAKTLGQTDASHQRRALPGDGGAEQAQAEAGGPGQCGGAGGG